MMEEVTMSVNESERQAIAMQAIRDLEDACDSWERNGVMHGYVVENYETFIWSWLSGWCVGLRSWLRGFDAQLGHLHDARTALLQKPLAAIKWLEITKQKNKPVGVLVTTWDRCEKR